MKLGTQIDATVSVDEAIRLAGLDWEVVRTEAGYRGLDGNWHVQTGRVALLRGDTGECLSNRGEGYEVVQFKDAFEFLDHVNPHFVAAGSLRGGKQAFAVVQLPEHVSLDVLDGQDRHNLFVIARASHDATLGVEANILPLRGMCMNMMSLPTLHAKHKMSWRHTRSVHEKMREAREMLDAVPEYAEEFRATAERLANIDLEIDEVKRIIDQVVPKDLATHDARVTDIVSLYETSSRNGYSGTAWGLLNAVSEWNDHLRGGEKRGNESRFVQGFDGESQNALGRTMRLLEARR